MHRENTRHLSDTRCLFSWGRISTGIQKWEKWTFNNEIVLDGRKIWHEETFWLNIQFWLNTHFD